MKVVVFLRERKLGAGQRSPDVPGSVIGFFCCAEYHKFVAYIGSSGRVGDYHGDEFRLDAGYQHSQVQWDDCNDHRKLERHIDRGHSADRGDHGQRRGHGGRQCQQRCVLHGGSSSEHHESVAHFGSRRGNGDGQWNEFRIDSRYQHGQVQRDDGNGQQLDRNVDQGGGAYRSDHGQRGGSRQRRRQQRRVVHSVSQYYQPVADIGSGGGVSNDHRVELRIDAGTSTVKFNGTTATTIGSWGTTSIIATVPTGATTGNVVVTVGGNASNGVSFTVVAAPNITSLSPTSGAVGATVTVNGTNFGSTQGTSTVKFNGTTATVSSWTATLIKVAVPTGAITGNVVVHASGVDSNGVSFTVFPSITSLSPTSGAVGASDNDHRVELRIDAGNEHGQVQWDDGDDYRQLGDYVHYRDGPDGSDHGQRRGHGGRQCQQRCVLHGGSNSEHHESVAHFGSRRGNGDGQWNEFRIDSRYQHDQVQRDGGNDDRELERHFDCGHSTDGSNNGKRDRQCQRSEQQRGFIHGSRGTEHHECVAYIGSSGRVGDDYGDERLARPKGQARSASMGRRQRRSGVGAPLRLWPQYRREQLQET